MAAIVFDKLGVIIGPNSCDKVEKEFCQTMRLNDTTFDQQLGSELRYAYRKGVLVNSYPASMHDAIARFVQNHELMQ